MQSKGRLIVIEGLDGSGKSTQAEWIKTHLSQVMDSDRLHLISFPDYKSESSAPIRMYLAGEIGAAAEVNAYAASSFYAADRYISYHTSWKKHFESGHTIIADRYTTSNIVHQMAKLPQEEWDGYLSWLYDFEFVRMGLPEPDVVIYLDIPPEVSRKLLMIRYGDDESRADIHERDIGYQRVCREAALFAAQKLGWKLLSYNISGEIIDFDEMRERISKVLLPLYD